METFAWLPERGFGPGRLFVLVVMVVFLLVMGWKVARRGFFYVRGGLVGLSATLPPERWSCEREVPNWAI